MSLSPLILLAVAIVLDLRFGDPRCLPHPVVGIGRTIAVLEGAWNRGSPGRRRGMGVLLTLSVVGGTFAVSWGLLAVLARLHPWLAWLAELWMLWTALAIKGLADAGRAVALPLRKGDLPAARRALAMIVGRDTERLDESEVARGAVETVAENTVDGITAPLFWALIGGAPLALAYKAVNTLDSMVGHRDDRYADFGYASAKLDDLANWLPARITALAIWLWAWASAGCRSELTGVNARDTLLATCREAPRHPSPNAGWPEAMVANLLGVQLGGTNHYRGQPSHRAVLGTPRMPLEAAHIERAIGLMHGGWIVTLGLLVSLAWLLGLAREIVNRF